MPFTPSAPAPASVAARAGATGGEEAPAQQPEGDREHRHDDDEHERAVGGVAEEGDEHDLGGDGGERRKKGGVRAISREMLTAGHLEDAERSEDRPEHQHRPAVVDHADDKCDAADEDRELRYRQAAEQPAWPLADRTPEVVGGGGAGACVGAGAGGRTGCADFPCLRERRRRELLAATARRA